MSNTAEDLWPEELTNLEGDRPPLVVMREQAMMLGKKTQNIVEAEVTAEPQPDGNLMLRFTLVAPALGNYRYDLLTATQPPTLYPISLRFEGQTWSAPSEDGLKHYLRSFFSSAQTKKVISGLLAQSKA